MQQKLIAIVGPTASGKTDIAIALAKKYNGYIISADSRQIYREMNIGTAKPTLGALQTVCGQSMYMIEGIQHFMFDIVHPDASYTVAEYKDAVYKLITDMRKQDPDKIPFLVGGTGLYITSIIENWNIPKVAPSDVRHDLEKQTLDDLVKELQMKVPDVAKDIDLKNKRRVLRALEVVLEGKNFDRAKGPKLFDVLVLGIDVPRKELYARIEKRVDIMMQVGLLDEVKFLAKKYGWNARALDGIGYRQFRQYFEKKITLDEAVENLKKDTRNYAKRQMTWWKKRDVKWVKNVEQAKKPVDAFLEK